MRFERFMGPTVIQGSRRHSICESLLRDRAWIIEQGGRRRKTLRPDRANVSGRRADQGSSIGCADADDASA